MSGYTPLFDSLTRGTLCGKWPDIGLWPVLLSMADWRGEIDATQQYIATVTGLPLAEVTACIQRFCEIDPGSRSQAEGGARLVLTDEHRDWGWRVVNIQTYRDKASDMKQVADGRNAAKVKRYRERHRATPADTARHQRTPRTPPDTDSNSNSNSNSNGDSNKNKKKTVAVAPDSVPGLNLEAWNRWFEYRGATKKPIKPPSIEAAMRELAAFGDSQVVVVQHSMANSYRGLFAPKSNGKAVSKWE